MLLFTFTILRPLFWSNAAAEMGSPNTLGKQDSPLPQASAANRTTAASTNAKSTSGGSTISDSIGSNIINNHQLNAGRLSSIESNHPHQSHSHHPLHLTSHSMPTYSLASVSNVSSASAAAAVAAASGAKQLLRVRRFLSTLHQFACELSPETGSNAKTFIFGLVVSSNTHTHTPEHFIKASLL